MNSIDDNSYWSLMLLLYIIVIWDAVDDMVFDQSIKKLLFFHLADGKSASSEIFIVIQLNTQHSKILGIMINYCLHYLQSNIFINP